jgi:hypothetical protein
MKAYLRNMEAYLRDMKAYFRNMEAYLLYIKAYFAGLSKHSANSEAYLADAPMDFAEPGICKKENQEKMLRKGKAKLHSLLATNKRWL